MKLDWTGKSEYQLALDYLEQFVPTLERVMKDQELLVGREDMEVWQCLYREDYREEVATIILKD